MSELVTEEDLCTICHRPQNDHPYRHKFCGHGTPVVLEAVDIKPGIDGKRSSNDASSDTASVAQIAPRVIPAGDPVLRIALMRAGVLTVEMLENIEAELRTAGVAYHDPNSLGQS